MEDHSRLRHAWLAITENNIGPKAYRPQEVVRAVNGVTILAFATHNWEGKPAVGTLTHSRWPPTVLQ